HQPRGRRVQRPLRCRARRRQALPAHPGALRSARGLAAALLALAACHAAPRDPLVSPSPRPPPPSLPPAAEGPRFGDPLGIQARGDDPLEKERLAVAVGAAGLLAGLDEGGEAAEVALAALPFADDAEIALVRLSDLLERARLAEDRRRL